jgi:hypothetical protein
LQDKNPTLEGIFRVSGNQQHVKDIKAVFDKGTQIRDFAAWLVRY